MDNAILLKILFKLIEIAITHLIAEYSAALLKSAEKKYIESTLSDDESKNYNYESVQRYNFEPIRNNAILPSPIPDEVPHKSVRDRNTVCPITCDEIKDPVYIVGDPTGTRFERSAITAWLESHNTNPITRSYCTTSYLRSDNELKLYMSQNPESKTKDTGSADVSDGTNQTSNSYASPRLELKPLLKNARKKEEEAKVQQEEADNLERQAKVASMQAKEDRAEADKANLLYQNALRDDSQTGVTDARLKYLKKNAEKSVAFANRSQDRANALNDQACQATNRAKILNQQALAARNKYNLAKTNNNKANSIRLSSIDAENRDNAAREDSLNKNSSNEAVYQSPNPFSTSGPQKGH